MKAPTLDPTTRHATRSSLIAVMSAGAIVGAAALALPAAGTPSTLMTTTARTTTTPALPCGAGRARAGEVAPLCTRTSPTSPTTTSTTTLTRSLLDFEDGTTQGWVSNSSKITVAAKAEGAQTGAFGLVVSNFAATSGKKAVTGPSITLANEAFAGSGRFRTIGLNLRVLARAKTKTPRTTSRILCGPTTSQPVLPVVDVVVETSSAVITSRTVPLGSGWNALNFVLPVGTGPVTVRLSLASGNATKLMLDNMSLGRVTPVTTVPDTTTITATTAADDDAAGRVVLPACTQKKSSSTKR